MKKYETQVVVVAGGLSGLAAAISAAENGAEVIVMEKAATTGGAANMGMGPFAVGTKYQRMQAFNMTPGEAFRLHMHFTHWAVDARLVRDYYFKSADTIEWLEDMGVEFLGVITPYPVPERLRAYATAYPTGHCVKPEGGGPPGPRCAATMIKRMTERALELGVNIMLETPGKKLIQEEGRIVGVIGVDKDGEEVEVRAKAVIIATGGMGDNPELIKKYIGLDWGKDLFSFRIPGMVGDGINMAWEVGAGKSNIGLELMYQCPDNMSVFSLDGAFRQPCLWVNKLGERFMNEDGIPNSTFTGKAMLRQPGHFALSVMDSAMVKKYMKNGPDMVTHVHGFNIFDDFITDVDEAIEDGYEYVYKTDTLEELAEQAGIDKEGFLKTVEEYNELCYEHYDTLFEKEAHYMKPIEKGPFYAMKYFIGAYGTVGGIKINHKTEVITEDHEKIPGLYSAGVDSCDIYGDCYPFTLAGNTMGYCLNSGRIAGENAAEYVNS